MNCPIWPDCSCGPKATDQCKLIGFEQHLENNPHFKPRGLIMKSESFKYIEPTRARVEREAMERMTKIYERRKGSQFIFNGLNPWYSPEYFPSISDQDVYGQPQTK